MLQDGHLEHHWGLITSKSIKNTWEYCYFQDSHKVIFSSLVGSLFALRDRKSDPKSAQEGLEDPEGFHFEPKGDPKSIKNKHQTAQVTQGTPKASKIDEKVTQAPSGSPNISKIY